MRIQRTHLRLVGLLLLVGTLVLLGLSLEPSSLLDPEQLRSRASEHPWKAAGSFVLAGLGLKLLFIPFSPLSLVGGLVFGGALGGTLALGTLMTASLISFGLGRGLGRGWVEDLVDDEEGKLQLVERILRERGLFAVVVLRVVPTLPLSAVNVLLGHSSVRVRDFVLGTALGNLPGVYLMAYVGDEALEPWSPRFWTFVALLGLVVAGGVVAGYRLQRRTSE